MARAAWSGGQWRRQDPLFACRAALEYERISDDGAALRTAEAAAATGTPLARIARERAELRSGGVAGSPRSFSASSRKARPTHGLAGEAYERLAVLDSIARKDPASAMLWHRAILEEQPGYAPSLRHVEHHLLGEGRDAELEPIATCHRKSLAQNRAGRVHVSTPKWRPAFGHFRRSRGELGRDTRLWSIWRISEGEPSLWALRMQQAHARARNDDATYLSTTLRVLERSTRPAEEAALLILAAEANSRLGRLDEARSLLERAAASDPGDVIAWGLLADVRSRAGDARGAAEAFESLARSSLVPHHQLLAWYGAARIWLDEVRDVEHGVVALEAAAGIDVAHQDVFDRLSAVYGGRKMLSELASLLERREFAASSTDPAERLTTEVQRGRVLLDLGDTEGARLAFEAALADQPDDAGALSAFADLCVAQKDWDAAEQALVRLARLLPTPEEQRDVYARLGDLYARHLVNLARAEVAFKEVLKRAPDDFETLEKLVEVYRRQNDASRAAELQQELITRARSVDEKRSRMVELAFIHEQTGHDNRRAEQSFEAARREFPQDVGVLRALIGFYSRHNQTTAINVLLDRAGGDARRALTAGRFTTQALRTR